MLSCIGFGCRCHLASVTSVLEHQISVPVLLNWSAQQVQGQEPMSHGLFCMQAMISEHLAAVRCAALRSLGKVLEAVDSLPPSDAKIFNE